MTRSYKIAVIGGDGIGPEVTAQALRALKAAAGEEGFALEVVDYPFGAEHYLATKEVFPESAKQEIRGMHAVLFGAIGDPRLPPGFLEKEIILGLRFGFDLYANLRPLRLYSEHLTPLKGKTTQDLDVLVVRENTEGDYCQIGGIHRRGTPAEVAISQAVHTRFGVERAVRYAFELAKNRPRKRLTLVDKANAIPIQEIWSRVYEEVSKEYPEVETDHAYVDACCMWLIKKPEWFDVIVTSNLFGDIITDLGAELCGGMGVAASGNIHPGKVSMFEPVHGSAPKHAGKGTASPIAACLAASMLCEHLGESRGAARIEDAVARLLEDRKIPGVATDCGMSTKAAGDLIVREVEAPVKRFRRAGSGRWAMPQARI